MAKDFATQLAEQIAFHRRKADEYQHVLDVYEELNAPRKHQRAVTAMKGLRKRVGHQRKRTGRTKADRPIASLIRQVLKNRKLTLRELTDAVRQAGWHTTSVMPSAVIGQTLRDMPDVRKVPGSRRGRYQYWLRASGPIAVVAGQKRAAG